MGKMVDDADTWLKEKQEELEKAGLLVDPPFTAREVEQQIRPVQSEVEYLRYRPKPRSKRKPVPKNTTGNATGSANGTGNSSKVSSNASEANASTAETTTGDKDDL